MNWVFLRVECFFVADSNAWLWHFLGWLQHHRSNELTKVYTQTYRLSGSIAVLSCRQRGWFFFIHSNYAYPLSHQKCDFRFQLLMLATNMIRKDLNSQNQYDAGVALSGLSCFISADLSRDLANDIMTLVSMTIVIAEPKLLLWFCQVWNQLVQLLSIQLIN